MLKLILLLFTLALANAVLTTSSESESDVGSCQDLLESAGASDGFGPKVAHAIHSLSLRTLKKFDPDVTENNRVPTINMNMSSNSNDAILFYAPDRSTPDSKYFHTEAMKILDEILVHMGDQQYDMKNFNPLERIAHAFHMEEMWASSLHEYRKLKRHNQPSEEICKCAMDIENNGILKKLRMMALEIREPELMYGTKINRSKRQMYGNIYSYPFNTRKRFVKRDIPGKIETDSQGNNDVLKDEKQSMPHLTSAEAWKTWKDMEGKKNYNPLDVAIFLYCALN